MIKKLLIVSFLFLFVMPFILADTTIKLKTPEFTEIHLTVLDPDADYSAFAIYKKTSDAWGDAEFTYTGDAMVFDLMVVLKKQDKNIYSNKFRENYVAGEEVYLEVIPDGYEIKETPTISGNAVEGSNATVNTTAPASENTTASAEEPETVSNITEEKSAKNKSSLFTFSFLKSGEENQVGEETKEKKSFEWLYIIGAAVLFCLLVFLAFRNYYNPTPRKIKVTKLSDSQPKFDSKSAKELMRDAEGRIKSAQKEIETLKKYKGWFLVFGILVIYYYNFLFIY